MRNLHARIRKLEEAEQGAELVDVVIRQFSGKGVGTLRVAGVVIARERGEGDEAYKARAFALAPPRNGVRVVHVEG